MHSQNHSQTQSVPCTRKRSKLTMQCVGEGRGGGEGGAIESPDPCWILHDALKLL